MNRIVESERRVRTVALTARDVLQIFQAGLSEPAWANLPRLNVPDGAQVLWVHLEEMPQRFVFFVHHPSFPPVEDGAIPPRLEGHGPWWEAVRLKRADAEADAPLVTTGNPERV